MEKVAMPETMGEGLDRTMTVGTQRRTIDEEETTEAILASDIDRNEDADIPLRHDRYLDPETNCVLMRSCQAKRIENQMSIV